MKPLGIAITTFNRGEMLMRHLEEVRRLTVTPFELVVCDDGSTDGTPEMLRKAELKTITGSNRGIAWNKNRGLFYLMNFTDCDPIILLDDDVKPNSVGWENVWRQSAELSGHANLAFYKEAIIGGGCTPQDPGLSGLIPGHIMVYSRDVLRFVGYMDTRFGKYGHEHTDLSLRTLRAGYGGYYRPGPKKKYLFHVIDSDVSLEPTRSTIDHISLKRNAELLWEVEYDPIYRLPWATDVDMFQFRDEIAVCRGKLNYMFQRTPSDFNESVYVDIHRDVRLAKCDPLVHYAQFGFDEGRVYTR